MAFIIGHFEDARRIGLVPAGQQKARNHGVAGRHDVDFGVPASARPAYRLPAVFFRAPWASGCALTAVEFSENAGDTLSLSATRAVYTRSRTPLFAHRFRRV